MRLPQIQITTTDIQMNWNTTDAVQKIKQPQAKIQMDHPAAILEINTTNAKLDIDMSQFWRDVNTKPMGEVIDDYVQKGRQGLLEGISRRVGEGKQMMLGAGKDQGRSTIQSIAKQNHGPERPGPYNIKFIPSYDAIKVDITPGTTDVHIQAQQVKFDATVNKVIHDYTPGNVSGTMTVRPDIEIDVIG